MQQRQEMRRRMHQPIPQQGKWLMQVISGFFNYHAVPTNSAALSAFRYHVTVLWLRALRRRSQKDRMTWTRMAKLAANPASFILGRASGLPSSTQGRSRVREFRSHGSVRGRSVMGVPTANLQLTPGRVAERGAFDHPRAWSDGPGEKQSSGTPCIAKHGGMGVWHDGHGYAPGGTGIQARSWGS